MEMEEEKPIPVLVTGATGFIGRNMVKYLLDCTNPKYKVIGTDLKRPTDPDYPAIPFLEKDLTRPDELYADDFQEVVKETKVQFHIAGLFDYGAPPHKLFEVNVLGTQNLFNAILKAKVKPRVVVWSAAGVFGNFDHIKLPATEEMPPKTDNPYLLSKLLEERISLNYWHICGIPVTVIRPSAVYGPGSTYGMALAILLIGRGVLPPMTVGNGKNYGALVHVYDVIRAAEFLSRHEKAVGEIFHVTDDGGYTTEAVTQCIAKEFDLPFIRWLKIPTLVLYKIVDVISKESKKLGVKTALDRELVHLITTNTQVSNEKLKRLGFEFRFPDSLEGLKDVIAWYKEKRWV